MPARAGRPQDRHAGSPPPLPPAGAPQRAPPGRMDAGTRPRTGRGGVGILPGALGTTAGVARMLLTERGRLPVWCHLSGKPTCRPLIGKQPMCRHNRHACQTGLPCLRQLPIPTNKITSHRVGGRIAIQGDGSPKLIFRGWLTTTGETRIKTFVNEPAIGSDEAVYPGYAEPCRIFVGEFLRGALGDWAVSLYENMKR